MNRIDALFARLKREGRRALMPFITAGDPDLPTTAALITEMVARGARHGRGRHPVLRPDRRRPGDRGELSPGPRGGVRLAHIFQTIRTLRAETADGPLAVAPLVTMVSYAIIHRQGRRPLPPRGGRPPGSTA